MADISELRQTFLDSCLNGQAEEVLRCLERNVPVNTTDALGRTGLMLACLQAHNHAVVRLLLQSGINVYALDNEGNAALDYAAQSQDPELEQLIRTYHPAPAVEEIQSLKSYDPSVSFQPKEASSESNAPQDWEELIRKRALEAVIEACDELKTFNEQHHPLVYFKKAEALLALDRKAEAAKVLHVSKQIFEECYGTFKERAKSWSRDVQKLYLRLISTQAKVQHTPYHEALWLYNEAYQLTDEPEQRYDFFQKRNQLYEQLVNLHEPGNLKKALYVEDELPTFRPQHLLAIKASQTGNLEFPLGKAQKKMLYLAHPFRSRTFYPYQEAPSALFQAKVNELIALAQYLGATRIVIESKKQGAESPEKSEYLFKPTQKPHLPSLLVWYHQQSDWQNMAQQRFEGVLQQIELLVNSNNIQILSSSEIAEIEEELQELQDLGYRKAQREKTRRGRRSPSDESPEISLQILREQSLSCSVLIEFAAKEQLTEEANSNIFTNYKVELPAFINTRDIEKDVFKASKKSFFKQEPKESIEMSGNKIESKQPAHSQSVRDTLKVEDVTNTLFATEEKAVVENSKPATEKVETENTTLEPSTPLSEEQLAEQRRQAAPKEKEVDLSEKFEKKDPLVAEQEGLSQEERYYFEMLQHAFQDGVISEDVRKVLERRRTRFKISAERAEELERLMMQRRKA